MENKIENKNNPRNANNIKRFILLVLFPSLIILFTFNINVYADINIEFENWKKNFKKIALKNNISEKTFDKVMSNTKFLSNVIKYDRFQPEFYEDTKTYISKRALLEI